MASEILVKVSSWASDEESSLCQQTWVYTSESILYLPSVSHCFPHWSSRMCAPSWRRPGRHQEFPEVVIGEPLGNRGILHISMFIHLEFAFSSEFLLKQPAAVSLPSVAVAAKPKLALVEEPVQPANSTNKVKPNKPRNQAGLYISDKQEASTTRTNRANEQQKHSHRRIWAQHRPQAQNKGTDIRSLSTARVASQIKLSSKHR